MSSPSAVRDAPEHIRDLLVRLHAESKQQEESLTRDDYTNDQSMHDLMRDKFIALNEDKAHYIYQLLRATGATTIVEAGTSFGVSTIYLALAACANAAVASGKTPLVIATEYEPTKAARARENWQQCGSEIVSAIDLREGDLLDTLKINIMDVDFLLLDIWTPLALPTLKLVQPHLRHGALVIADNTVSAAKNYQEFIDYVRAPDSGFIDTVVPFAGGLEVLVYAPSQ
ncbi:O-methyltransferase [Ophiostoma piceae UAMH 11346]|uniref:O-methyltransferase n=1 Tax=Ophiostoma piceae (strain UAMH 11346) TaxID=1262450 RepID=S3BST3_OPHP1|nr:O-methyltransferase [Ophiostoma piceae UAMH 11346]